MPSFLSSVPTGLNRAMSPNPSIERTPQRPLRALCAAAHVEPLDPIMAAVPPAIAEYHASGKPLVCRLDASPYNCEFWPCAELERYNVEYEVPQDAPGYFGFATSGGGEMFSLSPTGKIVCLAFIGMSPKDELFVVSSWGQFEGMLRPANGVA